MSSFAGPVSALSAEGIAAPACNAAVWVAAAVAVGFAIDIQNGEYAPAALLVLTVALACAGWALWLSGREPSAQLPWKPSGLFRGRGVVAVSVLLLYFQFHLLVRSKPSYYLLGSAESQLNWYAAGIGLSALLTTCGVLVALHAGFSRRRRPGGAWFIAVAGVHFLLGVWVLGATARPYIDVFEFQERGPQALLTGRNPYAIRDFPDIYRSQITHRPILYGPGMTDGRFLRFGFPYPPMSLYLATAGYVATGDHRFAQLTALTLAGIAIAATRGGGLLPKLAGATLLFTPRVFLVLSSGWTEPFLVLFLALTVFCACRWPNRIPVGPPRRDRRFSPAILTPVALGVLVACKQYALPCLALSALLVPAGRCLGPASWGLRLPRWGEWMRFLAIALGVAFAVTAPLALWNWDRFWFSTITVQQKAPFRWEALSYLVWFGLRHGYPTGGEGPFWPSALALLLTTGFSLWRAPRTPAGFAGAVALVYLAFFAFSKQAFANYYFFTIGAMCSAAAATPQVFSLAREDP